MNISVRGISTPAQGPAHEAVEAPGDFGPVATAEDVSRSYTYQAGDLVVTEHGAEPLKEIAKWSQPIPSLGVHVSFEGVIPEGIQRREGNLEGRLFIHASLTDDGWFLVCADEVGVPIFGLPAFDPKDTMVEMLDILANDYGVPVESPRKNTVNPDLTSWRYTVEFQER